MIGWIVEKEFTECRRDGRVLAIAGLIAVLVMGGLITGWSTHIGQQRQARQAQQVDQAAFLAQGEKPHHSAAHFGRMAYKPVPALAVFDPGAAPYLGQVIWLEAHRRDPAMFRPAEDSPELRRLADLSVAGVLTTLLPLITFLIGHGVFAAERERGTLRQVVSAGPDLNGLFAGKIIAVAGIPMAISLVTICVSTAIAALAPQAPSPADTLMRGAALVLAYGLYSLSLAAVALLVSARARTAASALLILLTLWSLAIVVLPRLAASVAQHVHPTPESGAFWSQASEAITSGRPARNSPELQAIRQLVVSRALGRQVTPEEAKSLNLDRRGLSLEISEILGARAYAAAYLALHETYEGQQGVRRWFSAFSPAIALQHLSSGLAGTDIEAHRHFADEAERQRNIIIRKMNEDMMLNGTSRSEPDLASAEFWRKVPDFRYEPPSASLAMRGVAMDFIALLSWSTLALAAAWWSARRMRVC
jgi:ABC-2 type transport system permease protein